MNDSKNQGGEVYDELGHVARQLHSAIVQMGLDGQLHRIAAEIPDARERLQYVGQLTERAAHRVLGLVEAAQPPCRSLQQQAADLLPQLQAAAAAGGEHAALLEQARALAETAAGAAAAQHETLGEIMLSQDFQDLSGQVIQKVVKIITETEDQLLSLLLKHAPLQASDLHHQRQSELQGPQVEGKAMSQGDVDELLASLGF
ncbi:MAG: protein phosphatase CheZ [Rubrivivax sp.]